MSRFPALASDPRIIAISPPHSCAAAIAIAAVRAGAIGLLHFGDRMRPALWHEQVERLVTHTSGARHWGVYWDVLEQPSRYPNVLPQCAPRRWPILCIGGLDIDRCDADTLLSQSRQRAECVLLEVDGIDAAHAAQAAGYDGVVLKGNEAGGRVSRHSSYILAQQARDALQIAYWICGGMHPSTAPAVMLSGATGIVLHEQLWLAREAQLDPRWQRQFKRCDGSETIVLSSEHHCYRLFARHNRPAVNDLVRRCETGNDWFGTMVAEQTKGLDAAAGSQQGLLQAGNDLAFCAALARRNGTVGHIVREYQTAIERHLPMARCQRALAPGSPLAKAHGTTYPLVQGPMTRVSDNVDFCVSVAEAGALPLLALGLMPGDRARGLMEALRDRVGRQPWGVGILAFLPPPLLRDQWRVVSEMCPPFVVLAGGRADQALELQRRSIDAYVHAPSPGVLETLLDHGVYRFVFEGRECGGHVGPRSSFTLWGAAVDVLLNIPAAERAKCHVLLAGGIHDAMSAAMAATIVAPLVEHGVQVGMLMGSSYIGTREAVATGAVTPLFQKQVLDGRETVLLESGLGHASRCLASPFAEEFLSRKRALVQSGKSTDQIRLELEMLCLGRLRIATKGRTRRNERIGAAATPLVPVDEATQYAQGLFMIGDAATMMRQPQSMRALHDNVCTESYRLLEDSTAGDSDADTTAHSPANTAPSAAADGGDEPPHTEKPIERVVCGSARAQCSARSAPGEPLAVIGIGCRFPDSAGVASYWQNIVSGFDAVTEVPADRWDADLFFTTDRFDRELCYSKWGSFLDNVTFDPLEYGIPPASMRSIEPVQLIALEVAKEALRDAGYYDRPFARHRTAVIFAVSGPHNLGMAYGFRTMLRQYLQTARNLDPATKRQVLEELSRDLPIWTEDALPGFLNNMVAGRISNHFDLRGPNFVVDAACAASLAALHIATEQLRSRTCDVALVGAADMTNSPVEFMSFAKVHALSPRGRACPFDDSADGIVLGEGVGAVVLKRLADAERDGDDIYAVIRGIGAASDGHNRSLTAPDRAGQIETLCNAYADAGIDPATLGLVEAHGTGTALGDRVECESLIDTLADGRRPHDRCAVGSVKSMIGHTKTAAGMASLIKACMALTTQVLPPTNNVTVPNRHLDFQNGPIYINTEPRPWIHDARSAPRRAGVSAFGFGGTNFHVVLEEHTGAVTPSPRAHWATLPAHLFAWRATDRTTLSKAVQQFDQRLNATQGDGLLALSRATLDALADERLPAAETPCRLALVAKDHTELQAKIAKVLPFLDRDASAAVAPGSYFRAGPPAAPDSICFLFPGQGSQRLNMLRDLAVRFSAGLSVFAHADEVLADQLDQPLSRYIYPEPVFDDRRRQAQQRALDDTAIAQPALGTAALFALELLQTFGISPGSAAGHSYGEIVALHLAGCMSRQQMLLLSARRGALVQQSTAQNRGGMAVVFAGVNEVRTQLQALSTTVAIANINAPAQTVIAGEQTALSTVVQQLTASGMRCRALTVTAAFHTPELQSAAVEFADYLKQFDLSAPQLPVYATATAQPYPYADSDIRRLMTGQLTESVRFVDQIQALYAAGARTFVEVGPGSTLTQFTDKILANQPHAAIPLDVDGRNGVVQLAHALAQAFVAGVPIRFAPWFAATAVGTSVGTSVADQSRTTKSTGTPRRRSQWILSGNGARPFDDPKKTLEQPVRTMPQAPAPPIDESEEQTVAPAPVEPQAPSPPAVALNRSGDSMHQQYEKPVPQSAPSNGDAFQHNMALWFELQNQQQQNHAQFLRLQERYLDYLQNGGTACVENNGGTQAADDPSSNATPQRLAPLHVPPAPTLPPIAALEGTPTGVTPSAQPHDGTLIDTTTTPQCDPGTTPAIVSVEDFRRLLLDIVIDRTGYDEESLDEDLLMEADLGIDSIKRIEIFSALGDACAFMSRQDRSDEELLMTFTSMKTIRDIIDAYSAERDRYVDADGNVLPDAIAAGDRLEDLREFTGEDLLSAVLQTPAAPADAELERYVVDTISAPLPDAEDRLLAWPADHVMLVVIGPGADGVASRPPSAITGLPLCWVRSGDAAAHIEANHYTVDLASAESVRELHTLLQRDKVRVGGLLNVLALNAPYSQPGANRPEVVMELLAGQYHLLREFEAELRASVPSGAGKLVNVSSMGGRFGIGGAAALPVAQAVTVGLYKTVGCEWRGTVAKCIDVPADCDLDWLLPIVVEELAADDSATEIGRTPDDRRHVEIRPAPATLNRSSTPDDLDQNTPAMPLDTPAESAGASAAVLSKDSVILVTGGGRGITAEIVKLLARSYGCHLVLLGRTPLADQSDATSTAAMSLSQNTPPDPSTDPASTSTLAPDNRADPAAELAETIEQLQQTDARVDYRVVDVRDTTTFAAAIESVYAEYGHIDGVIHGAGVTDDRLISSKTVESLEKVIRTKVDSAQVLASTLRPDDLKFMFLFSSVTARFGTPGQSDYCAANEYLNKLADYLNVHWPARVVAIDWGPWDRGLVTPQLAAIWASMQIHVIPSPTGAEALLAEVQQPTDEFAEIVVGCSIQEIARRRLSMTP